jgi:hypothetical protein
MSVNTATAVLQLFAELIVLPTSANRIKCYDFDKPMNSSSHFASSYLRQFL